MGSGLPLTGGGHEGGGAHRCPNLHKQKAEHGRAVYCYATVSGSLQGGKAERGSAGNTEMVGSDGHIWDKAKAREVETESVSESGTDLEGEESQGIDNRASG